MNKWLSQVQPMTAAATAGMADEQLVWHPEGKWSAAQILDHLRKTYHGTVRGYEKALANDRSLATRTSAFQRIAKFTLLDLGYFPRGRKSPKMVEPELHCDGRATLAIITAELARLADLQRLAELRFPKERVMDHPVLGPLTAQQWARFHYIHARHHMKQIAALRQQMATATSAVA